MKRSKKLLALLLVLCTLALCACTITYPVDAPDSTEQPTDTDAPVLHGPVLSYISDYTVIYPTRATNGEKDAAMQVMNAIDNSRRPEVDYLSNKEEIPHNNREILIGNTNRTASQTAIAALNKDRDFSVSFNKDEVVIAAKTDAALADAVTYFLGTVLTADISHYSVGTVDTQLYSYPLSGFFGLSLDALEISYSTKDLEPAAKSLQTYIHDVTGADAKLSLGGNGNIQLSLDKTMDPAKYSLEPQGKTVTLRSGTVLAANAAVKRITTKGLGGRVMTLTGGTDIPLTMKDIKNPAKELNLVWFDEFDGTGLNGDYWSLTDRMYADNKKMFTTTDSKVFEVKNGEAVMRAYKDGDKYYTNKTLTTMGRMSFQYGYLEMYAKVPTARGAFPSFWLQSAPSHRTVDYMTEVDVFEIFDWNKMEFTTHKWYFNKTTGKEEHHCWNDPKTTVYTDIEWDSLSKDYHRYGFGWTQTEMYFTVDGKVCATVDITNRKDFCQGVNKITDENGNVVGSLTGMEGFQDPLFINFNNWIHRTASFRTNGENTPEDKQWKVTDDTEYPIEYSIAWIRLYQDETGVLWDDLHGKISDGIK